MKKNLIERIESEILKTPSGELRNLLADMNIYLQSQDDDHSPEDSETIK